MPGGAKATLHCWENGPTVGDDEMSTTCMLEADHEGPHEWTRDDEFVITFAKDGDIR